MNKYILLALLGISNFSHSFIIQTVVMKHSINNHQVVMYADVHTNLYDNDLEGKQIDQIKLGLALNKFPNNVNSLVLLEDLSIHPHTLAHLKKNNYGKLLLEIRRLLDIYSIPFLNIDSRIYSDLQLYLSMQEMILKIESHPQVSFLKDRPEYIDIKAASETFPYYGKEVSILYDQFIAQYNQELQDVKSKCDALGPVFEETLKLDIFAKLSTSMQQAFSKYKEEKSISSFTNPKKLSDINPIDVNIVCEILQNKNKKIILFAGGDHIQKVTDILSKLGYEIEYNSKITLADSTLCDKCDVSFHEKMSAMFVKKEKFPGISFSDFEYIQ